MAMGDYRCLTNPLVTANQLVKFQHGSQSDTQAQLFNIAVLTQTAGILCRLPQDVIVTAIVLLQRYRLSVTPPGLDDPTASAAVIYLAAKLSFTPLAPRSIVNVFAYLNSSASPLTCHGAGSTPALSRPEDYYVSEGTYERRRADLYSAEATILASLSFDTYVAVPHSLALTYVQALGVTSPRLSRRVIQHLNGALLSPQVLYLTHQPNALAVAAIYLAAREVDVKLVEENWWEVFDVDREDLGFLVLAMGSFRSYAISEKEALRTEDQIKRNGSD